MIKRLLYILTLLLLAVPAPAQQILSGYVYDEAENKPLEGAFVYLDGTGISANTDAQGRFTIKTDTQFTGMLVVSYVGFRTLRLENPFSYTKAIKILLQEDAIQMNEVVITNKSGFTRKQMLRVFRQEFLGESAAGTSCTIENEDDIQLYYDAANNTLNATALKPLRIKNKRLQYDVVFDLLAFRVDYSYKTLGKEAIQRSFYAGSTFFTDSSENGSADKKRKEAYLGSAVHLMKTIASDSWQKEKFGLYVDKFPADPHKYFSLSDTINLKKVTVNNNTIVKSETITMNAGLNRIKQSHAEEKVRFAVLYDKKQQSFFEVAGNPFYIDAHGLFYPIEGIIFGGYIAALKAGDLLPLEYKYTD